MEGSASCGDMKTRMMSARCCCDEELIAYREYGTFWSERVDGGPLDPQPWRDYGYLHRIDIGRIYRDPIGSDPIRARFNGYLTQNINVHSGTAIQSATIELFADVTNGNYDPTPVNVNVYVQDSDHVQGLGVLGAQVFSGALTGRSAPNHTSFSYIGPVSVTIQGDAVIDITSIVQQVIDRPGWLSTSSIGVVILVDDSDIERLWDPLDPVNESTTVLYWTSQLSTDPTVTEPGTNVALKNRLLVVI